jgi:hypothetical protein
MMSIFDTRPVHDCDMHCCESNDTHALLMCVISTLRS